MAHRDPSPSTPMPTILRYCIAVLSVAIGIGLDFFLLRHFDAKLTPFLLAVAATFGTQEPDQVCFLSLNYFFLHSFFSFSPISYADLVYLTFCIFAPWLSAGSAPCDDGQSKSFVRPTRSSTPKSAPSKDAACASLSAWGLPWPCIPYHRRRSCEDGARRLVKR
jgi:hypothetical protein